MSSPTAIPLDEQAAVAHLMEFLAIEGVTGEEAAIADTVSQALKAVGVPESAIRFDDAQKRIPLPTQTGNLIAELPGTRPGPRLLFSTHLDTVPLCAGARPQAHERSGSVCVAGVGAGLAPARMRAPSDGS